MAAAVQGKTAWRGRWCGERMRRQAFLLAVAASGNGGGSCRRGAIWERWR